MTTVIHNARVLTLSGPRPRRGPALADLGIYKRADIVIEKDRITSVGAGTSSRGTGVTELDAKGRIIMPAFIDCHTHACWAGDRLDEWQMKLAGAQYLDILKAGGGIMSTVRAVRAASESQLLDLLRTRLAAMLHAGSATVEVKSGYGLTTEAELKMLRVIHAAAAEARQSTGQTIVPTALLGHAIDPDVPNFTDKVIAETLPAIHAEFPHITIDAFCETGAWSVADSVRLFERAKTLGHNIRIHADQFNSLGMLPQAVRLGAASVDHLEASSETDLDRLAASITFGVILPACGFHVDGRYARVRRFIDKGGRLALATNYNPGSAPSPSMSMAIALAVRHCGLSIAEAIHCATINPAFLIGLPDRGQLIPGQRADLIMLRHTDERMLAYEFGADPIEAVMVGGSFVRKPV